jgi:hypothetical protein
MKQSSSTSYTQALQVMITRDFGEKSEEFSNLVGEQSILSGWK